MQKNNYNIHDMTQNMLILENHDSEGFNALSLTLTDCSQLLNMNVNERNL